MKKNGSVEAIPKDVAYQICAEIKEGKAGGWFTQYWGCVRFSKGDPTKMCVSSQPDYRGCKLVNERYDRMNR